MIHAAKHFNLAIIGFGNVGKALAQHLLSRQTELNSLGITFSLVGVATRRLGFIENSKGLDISSLLSGKLSNAENFDSEKIESWLKRIGANVVFELSSLDPFTGQPAISHIEQAFVAGAHVITANKGPLVHAYAKLQTLADSRDLKFRFEAATADSVPVYSSFRETLPLSRPSGFKGILNGTTSVILESMENGASFEDGVRRAQELGIAETDPSFDVDGYDAAVKVVAIANVLMNANIQLEDVERSSIRAITAQELMAAKNAGEKIRLVSRIFYDNGKILASVKPERLATNDPLNIDTMSLALHFEMDEDLLPALTLMGHRLTASSTAYGVLCDFINIAK